LQERLQIGWSQAVPFQPVWQLQVVLSAASLPWVQLGLGVAIPKAPTIDALTCSFEYATYAMAASATIAPSKKYVMWPLAILPINNSLCLR
jgi:hypothetical protein